MDALTNYTPPILRQVEAAGGRVFRGDPYDLNLVAIRRPHIPGVLFGDDLIATYKLGGRWVSESFACTTKPTPVYLTDPINEKGTAILTPGQHRAAWVRGAHRGRPALVQTGAPVVVYRDNDRDDIPEATTETETGYFGINIHDVAGDPLYASAGCVVLPTSSDLSRLLALVNAQYLHGFGGAVSLSILSGGG